MALDFMSFVMGKSTSSGGAQPSGNIGYQVKFKVDGSDYYIASCQQGESITEPPVPVIAQQIFNSWQDKNGNDILFPYTPTQDIELTANFNSFNFLVAPNENICQLKNWSSITTFVWKDSDETAICAYGVTGTTSGKKNTTVVAIHLNEGGTIQGLQNSNGTIEYNGTTYYVNHVTKTETGIQDDMLNLNRYKFSDTNSWQNGVIETLNAYFGVTK